MHAAADAYSRLASQYTEKLGSMAAVHADDRLLVDSWAEQTRGPALDAGCGPGHWTHHLASRGRTVLGIDIAPAFIDHARSSYPSERFDVADIDHLPHPNDSFGLVLSWYSTIHQTPDEIHRPLSEFARVLARDGVLILGFFEGATLQSFNHAVTTAYRWPTSELAAAVERAGFTVVGTHHRTAPDHRPHGAIVARLQRREANAPER